MVEGNGLAMNPAGRAHRVWAVTALVLALATASSPAALATAGASRRASVYRGRLGPHGRIQLDIAGAHARLDFTARCKDEGPNALGEELVGSYPPRATEPSFEPVSGNVRRGRVAIDVEQPGESKDEARGAPTAHVRLHAKVTPERVSGEFSMDVEAGASLFDEPGPAEHCKTPELAFTAARIRVGGGE